ncbi:MAG: aminopeptidase P family protein [Spirochaetales bacterium]|nr:aminopeptidase P family protein [Spirochaetales bacterium]
MHAARNQRLRQEMGKAGLDGIVLFPGSTFAYLAGYTPLSLERFVALVLPTRGESVLVAPLVEADYVAERIGVQRTVRFPDHVSPVGAVGRIMGSLDRSDGRTLKLGIEYARARLFERETLSLGGPQGFEMANVDPIVELLRMRKDQGELRILSEAASIATEAIMLGCERLGPGCSEKEVAEAMRESIRERGAVPFQASAVSGPETAFPHAVQTGRRFQRGDTVLVAAVLTWRGYYADLTLTAGIAPLSGATADMIEGARRMQAAAVGALGPDSTPDRLDRAAREAGAPYTRDFLHRSGHGVGLDVHEPPFLNIGGNRPIQPGAVMSIEPGLYIPGVGGARFEDEFLLTETGNVEKLSELPQNIVAG